MTDAVADIVSEQVLRESFRKHAALAQFHRLLQFGEHPDAKLDCLIDLLSADVELRNGGASIRGHDEVRAAAASANATPLAHFVKSWDARVDGGTTYVVAQVDQDDGSVRRSGSRYHAAFVTSDTILPKLSRLDVEPGEVVAELKIENAFAVNRARSLIHYFMALVENPQRDPEPFFELLAPVFSLHYTAEPLVDHAAVRRWVGGALSSVIASEHVLHSIVVAGGDAGCTNADVTMKSQAMFPDKSGAISRNKQVWSMVDDVAGRFARIERILIDRDAVIFFDATGRETTRPG